MSEKRSDESTTEFTIRRILDDEAEACAKIADDFTNEFIAATFPSLPDISPNLRIAAAIRARITKRHTVAYREGIDDIDAKWVDFDH